ncbi:hypothetical protein HA402_001041 [Bradysia odoriphaga]|nr:hypothetical protein HA402_001041 [Bradysia odoriphaga]
MDENNSIIYGLESQARSLTPQLAEPKEIRFFIATQTLKPNNQLHLIELNESSSSLSAKLSEGVSSCNAICAYFVLPESLENTENKEYLSFESTDILDTQAHGNEIKTTEFHPTDSNKLATVIDGKILLHEQTEAKVVVVSTLTGKNSPKYSTGKWSQHHQGNQFVCLYDCGIRSYDIRDPNHCAWQIEDGQFIRDLDCNPNKQCLLVTGGDDGTLKIWDTRNIKEPVFLRSDHSHW